MTTLKPLLTILAVAITAVVIAALPTTPQPVTLMWDGDPGWETNTVVKIYTHTNVAAPKAQWLVITNAVGTNTVTFLLQPGVHFFAATASNFWGESDFSNVVLTPPLPKADNLQIRKGL